MTIQEIEAACQYELPMQPVDIVHARMEYPFVRMFYPLGFSVEIASNSERVLDIASTSWAAFHRLFDTPPIRIQVGVLDGHSVGCPPVPTCRVQQHLFSFVADQGNYGLVDMEQGFCGLWMTTEAVKHASYVRHFFLECAIICPIATRFTTGAHAGCVSWNGTGVLLCGDSGAGKSTLSYACAKAGWTYTTDDGSYMVHGSDELLVVGNCHQVRFRPAATGFFSEIEGMEITQRAEIGKPSIEISPETIPGIRCSQSAKVKYFVVLNRREGINAPLRPYSKEVVRRFLHQGRFTPLNRMPAHGEAIERLLKLDILELPYLDLDWAMEQLNSLVATGRP